MMLADCQLARRLVWTQIWMSAAAAETGLRLRPVRRGAVQDEAAFCAPPTRS
jgi:hypothetical protein